MNTDFPPPSPRDELEARITALLLGELSAPDAAALRAQIATDPELAALEARLKPTIAFLKLAAAEPEGEKFAPPEPLQLSPERREVLQRWFKGEEKEKEEEAKIIKVPFDWRTWGSLAAMVAFLVAILGSMMLPSLAKAKAKAQRNAGSVSALSPASVIHQMAEALPEELQVKAHPGNRSLDRLAAEKSPESLVEMRVANAPVPMDKPAALPALRGAGAQTDRLQRQSQSQIALPMDDGFESVEVLADNGGTALGAAVLGDRPVLGRAFGGGGGAADNKKATLEFGINPNGRAEDEFYSKSIATTASNPADVRLRYYQDGASAGVKESPPGVSAGAAIVTESATPLYRTAHTDFIAPVATPASAQTPNSQTEGRFLFGGAASPNVNRRAPQRPAILATAPTAASGVEAGKDKVVAGIPAEMPAKKEAQTTVAFDFQEPGITRGNSGMGGMSGAGSKASTRPGTSNQELMKGYFPQMYDMLQRGRDQAPAASTPPPAAMGMEMAPAQRSLEALAKRPADARVTLRAESLRKEIRAESAGRNLNELADLDQKLEAAKESKADGRELDALEAQKSEARAKEREIALEEINAQIDKAWIDPVRPAAPTPQPEVMVAENAFSTFSLNVSDVSFKLAAASLEKGQMPEAAAIRSEEFINAFDYRDLEPTTGAPVAFAWERARYPFAHDRDLLRFSVKTAATGREAGRPLNLVLLLDASGSMERADRVRIIQECLRVLGGQLQAQDRVSVVAFARKARLWVDGLAGDKGAELPSRVGNLTPEGGTNLEEAMDVAYQTAFRHFLAGGVNRVVLLTDGAANLGDVDPASLKKKVEARRKQGIALDCFGIGWDGLNDDLLENLSRNGDGRYGFVNTPEAATTEFAAQLAGALKVAASDVKVQVEFNAKRATAYRQIGYAKHQLTKEQFRDNTVDAAELGAAEAGNALYVVQVNPAGEGPIATVRVRFKIPGTNDYREHEWAVPYEGASKTLTPSTATMRLATATSAFSEWLAGSPYAASVTPDSLLRMLSNLSTTFGADPRPKTLETMIRQAKSLAGK